MDLIQHDLGERQNESILQQGRQERGKMREREEEERGRVCGGGCRAVFSVLGSDDES